MSKRNSTGANNTLFNYFSKTPPANKKIKTGIDNACSPEVERKENIIESKF